MKATPQHKIRGCESSSCLRKKLWETAPVHPLWFSWKNLVLNPVSCWPKQFCQRQGFVTQQPYSEKAQGFTEWALSGLGNTLREKISKFGSLPKIQHNQTVWFAKQGWNPTRIYFFLSGFLPWDSPKQHTYIFNPHFNILFLTPETPSYRKKTEVHQNLFYQHIPIVAQYEY